MRLVAILFAFNIVALSSAGQTNFTYPYNFDAVVNTNMFFANVDYRYYTDKLFYIPEGQNLGTMFFFKDQTNNGGNLFFGHDHCGFAGTKSSAQHVFIKYMFSDEQTELFDKRFHPKTEHISTPISVTITAKAVKEGDCGNQTVPYDSKVFRIRVEQPKWNAEEIKKLCNGIDKEYKLDDYFSATDKSFVSTASFPAGTTYTLNGAPVTSFNPKSLSIGTHTIIAKRAYDNAATDVAYGSTRGWVTFPLTIEILESSPITITDAPSVLCFNSPNVIIDHTPLGGEWSGNGIDQDGNFNAANSSIGINNLKYSYTNPTNGCVTTKTIQIKVNAPPAVNISNQGTSICQSNDPISLPSGTPAGGIWTAQDMSWFVSPATVNPNKMPVGTDTIKYTINDGTCSNTANYIVNIRPVPQLTVMNDFYTCTNSIKIALQSSPAGLWSGEGVDNNAGAFYDPSLTSEGTHELTCKYTDPSTGCSTTKTIKATTYATPKVALMADTSICISAGTLQLTASPAAGTWSGTGVTGNNFTPRFEGISQLTYAYTNPQNKCSNSGVVNIEVKGLPGQIGITGDTIACLNNTVTLSANAANVSDFAWYKSNEANPFATGLSISYPVNKNEAITVKPRVNKAGDCPAPGRIVNIIMNSPVGAISYTGADTLEFGYLFSATSNITNVASYNWIFGDGGYSYSPTGNHYYNKAGKYTPYLKATSSSGCITNFSIGKEIYVKSEQGKAPDGQFTRGSGIDSTIRDVNVYPTAFRDKITITMHSKKSQPVKLRFIDQGGKMIKEIRQNALQGNNQFIINVDFQKAHGVYMFLMMITEDRTESYKLFKL